MKKEKLVGHRFLEQIDSSTLKIFQKPKKIEIELFVIVKTRDMKIFTSPQYNRTYFLAYEYLFLCCLPKQR